jgi:hypothetical protein
MTMTSYELYCLLTEGEEDRIGPAAFLSDYRLISGRVLRPCPRKIPT